MEEQGTLMEQASFKFSQDANCISGHDDYEFLEIEAVSSLGIDRDNDCFFVIKTKKWSVDSAEDLEKLFDRIRQVVIKKQKGYV
jgi:hypothetical protein